MKIIYRGGYQTENAETSLFYEYAGQIKKYISEGKNVVYVTFAKPNNYYDSRIIESLGFMPQVIDTNISKGVDWSKFDLIIIPGGETEVLKKALIEWGFEINKLNPEVVIIGDSAGAYVLSKYYFGKKQDNKGGLEYFILEGLNAGSNLLTVAHIDNPKHVDQEKLMEAQGFSEKLGTSLLLLKENEAKLLEDGGMPQDFSIDEVLNV